MPKKLEETIVKKHCYMETRGGRGYYSYGQKYYELLFVNVLPIGKMDNTAINDDEIRNGVSCSLDFDVNAFFYDARLIEQNIKQSSFAGKMRVETLIGFDCVLFSGDISTIKSAKFTECYQEHSSIDSFFSKRVYDFEMPSNSHISINIGLGESEKFICGGFEFNISKMGHAYHTKEGPAVKTIVSTGFISKEDVPLSIILEQKSNLNEFIDMVTRIENRAEISQLKDSLGRDCILTQRVVLADNHVMIEPLLNISDLTAQNLGDAYVAHCAFISDNDDSYQWFKNAVHENNDANVAFMNASNAAEQLLNDNFGLIMQDAMVKIHVEGAVKSSKNKKGFHYADKVKTMLLYMAAWPRAAQIDANSVKLARNIIAHPKGDESRKIEGMLAIKNTAKYGLIFMAFYQMVYLIKIGFTKEVALTKISKCTFFYMPNESLTSTALRADVPKS